MDDFSQIIGFILAIIFFVASAIRKKNKKNGNTKKGNPLNEALESFLGGQSNTTEESVYQESEHAFFKEEETVYQEPIKKPAFEKSKPSILNEKRNQNTQIKKKENIKRYQPRKATIDLKQAVIYSEILNRKEF